MCAATPAPDRRRGGYSILELLVVLAIMSAAAAIVIPMGATMMERLVIHAVQFELQRDLAALRREAFRSQTELTVYDSAPPVPPSPTARQAPLRAGWSWRAERPLRITAGGVCAPASLEVYKLGRTAMRLTSDAACRLTRWR